MISVSVETISPENFPSMRTEPSKSSLPSNWLPFPSSALSSVPGRGGVGMVVTLDGAGVGGIGAVGCAMLKSSRKDRCSNRSPQEQQQLLTAEAQRARRFAELCF